MPSNSFRHWALGRRTKNNGVLMLVAPAEHKVTIEVGYGLEGTLTDALVQNRHRQRHSAALQGGRFSPAGFRGASTTSSPS